VRLKLLSDLKSTLAGRLFQTLTTRSLNKPKTVIIRLEAVGFSRVLYSLYGAFGGVRAFGYNSAESEPIWMTPGAL